MIYSAKQPKQSTELQASFRMIYGDDEQVKTDPRLFVVES